MNWKEISEKYPKAFAEMIARLKERGELGHWGAPNPLYGTEEWSLLVWREAVANARKTVVFNPRDLYDYFDGLGIWGYVTPSDWLSSSSEIVWYYRIRLTEMSDRFNTRTAAESALFTRMFEIRESQLLEGEAK